MARTGLAGARRMNRIPALPVVEVAPLADGEITAIRRNAITRNVRQMPNWKLIDSIERFSATGEAELVTKCRRELARRERAGIA